MAPYTIGGVRMAAGASTVSAVEQVATIAVFSWQQAGPLGHIPAMGIPFVPGTQKGLKSWCEPREGNQRLIAMGTLD